MAWETRTDWNRATNPRLTDPYGTIAVPDIQTNRATVPRPASGNGWSVAWGTGGAGTTAYMYQLLTATWTAAPTGGSRRIRPNLSTGVSVIPVTPGETITGSFDIASNLSARITVDFNLGASWVSSVAAPPAPRSGRRRWACQPCRCKRFWTATPRSSSI